MNDSTDISTSRRPSDGAKSGSAGTGAAAAWTPGSGWSERHPSRHEPSSPVCRSRPPTDGRQTCRRPRAPFRWLGLIIGLIGSRHLSSGHGAGPVRPAGGAPCRGRDGDRRWRACMRTAWPISPTCSACAATARASSPSCATAASAATAPWRWAFPSPSRSAPWSPWASRGWSAGALIAAQVTGSRGAAGHHAIAALGAQPTALAHGCGQAEQCRHVPGARPRPADRRPLPAGLAARFGLAWWSALVAAYMVSEIARRQIGGYTGDVLGAAQEIAQLAILINIVSLA